MADHPIHYVNVIKLKCEILFYKEALKSLSWLYKNYVIMEMVISYLKMWKSAGKGFPVSNTTPIDIAYIWLTCYKVTVYQYGFMGFPRLQRQRKRHSLKLLCFI